MSINKFQGYDFYITEIKIECTYNQIDLSLRVEFNKKMQTIQFFNVSMLTIKDFSYPMYVQGFEIIDNRCRGWENDSRFRVHDYEDESINFYCEKVCQERQSEDGGRLA